MTVTVRTLGDLVIWLGALAAAVLAIIGLARLLIFRPLKNLIKDEVVAQLRETRQDLDTLTGRFEEHVHTHPPGSPNRARRTA